MSKENISKNNPDINSMDKNNNLRCKSLKRKSISEINHSASKRVQLNSLNINNMQDGQINYKNTENNNVSDSMGTSDSPFTESLNSNLFQTEEGSSSDYICSVNEPKSKHLYKVTEIYQIGFQVGETERIYIPNMLDSQDISYQYQSDIPLSGDSVNDIWNNMTPMILGSEYQVELREIQTDGMAQLERYLSFNLTAMAQRAELQQTDSMLSADWRMVELRQLMMDLIKSLWPSIEFKTPFNGLSIQMDYFIDRLVSRGNSKSRISSSDIVSIINQPLVPVVLLYPNLEEQVDRLRQKSLTLIKMLLPVLKLPPEFQIKRDLCELIRRICSIN